MHELALSESIVDAVLSAEQVKGRRLRVLAVEVGALSSVNVDTLEFCLRLVLEQRGHEGVQTRITSAPALLQCRCGARYQTEDIYTPCPECGGWERDVVSGTDVRVQYVEVDEHEQDRT